MNVIVTDIQLNAANDTVSFYNRTQLIKTMSRIMPSNPNFMSYRYDTITIANEGESFSFQIYPLESIGTVAYTVLNFSSTPSVVEAKTIQAYNQLTTFVFQACCDCSGGGSASGCFATFELSDSGSAIAAGEISFRNLTDPVSSLYMSDLTYNSVQDFSGLYPLVEVGSWIFVYNVEDPSNYYIFQVETTTVLSGSVLFEGPIVSKAGPTDNYGALFCVDFAVSSTLTSVPRWQQTLLVARGSELSQDNEVYPTNFGEYGFVFRDFNNIIINAGRGEATLGLWNYSSPNVYNWVQAVETNISLISGESGDDIGVIAEYQAGLTLKTLNYASANVGDILVFDGQYVTYAPANAGTVSSVGLSMPAAFTVTNSPITGSGTIGVIVNGLVTEYIDGTGALQTLPVYIGANGLNNTTTPTTIELGGTLNKNTIIQTTNGSSQYGLAVTGTANQTSSYPFLVSNLGTGGVAYFQDYSSGTRNNPSVQVLGDVDLFQPLLELRMNGDLPNSGVGLANKTTMFRLNYTGEAANARTSIDYQFQNSTPASFIASRLTTEITNFTAGSENANYEIQLVRSGNLENKVVVESKGQLELTNYRTAFFADGTTNINDSLTYVLAVDSNGKIWKKLVSGGGGSGSVTQVSTAGLITTVSGLPITTTGTITTSMTDGKLVGRWTSAGTGIMQEIVIGAGLELTTGGTLQSTSIATAGSGLSQAGTVVNLGQPSKLLSNSNPITQDAWIYTDGYKIGFTGVKLEPIVFVENTTINSNNAPAFGATSDGGSAVVATQNFTGTITSSYIGKTAALAGFSNVGYGVSAESRLSPAGYFQLFYSLTPITEPAVYIVKNERSKTRTYDEILRIERAGPGAGNAAPNVGFGAVTSYRMRYASPVTSIALAGSHGFAWIDPTVQTSEFIVAPTLSGVENIRLKVTGDGQLKLMNYNSLTAFPGVAIGVLGFDATGNILTVSGGGGGGGGLTGAINGLSVVGTNALLGGPLTQSTTITNNGFGLNVSGAQGGIPSLTVLNASLSSNQSAIFAQATGTAGTGLSGQGPTIGVAGFSTDGIGVEATSTNNSAITGVSNSFYGADLQTNKTILSLHQGALSLQRRSPEAAVNGISTGIDIAVKDSTGTANFTHFIRSKWVDVASSTKTSQYEIWGVNNANPIEPMFTMKGTGQMQFNKYNNPSLFNGVVSAYLAVDINGNVIQESGGPSSGISQLIGDVAASGSGTVSATIQPGVVTYSKIQPASATSKLLGTGSSTTYGEISLGTGFSIVSGSLEYSGSGSAITALTGDVIATGPGSVGATIPNGTITYPKMQTIATADRVLGSTTAGGTVSEVQVSTNMIATGAVTYARMQNVASNTFLANVTGSAVSVQEISTSRIPLFASNISGTPSGTTFLRGDGQWAAPSGASPLTTKGDLYTFDTANTRLPVGTNGQILIADSTTATGLRWGAGGGGSYTSSNGITLTGSNFGLGGSLDGNTTITHTSDALNFTGTGSLIAGSGSVVSALVHMINTQSSGGTGYGLEVVASGSNSKGLFIQGGSSTGGGSTVDNALFGVSAFGQNSLPYVIFDTTSRQNTRIIGGSSNIAADGDVVKIEATTVSNPANIIGLYSRPTLNPTSVNAGVSNITFRAKGSTGVEYAFSQISGGTQDYVAATRTGFLDFKVINNGNSTLLTRMTVKGNGQIQLPAYTTSSIFPGSAVASLAVDSSGNIITVTGSGTSLATLSDVQLSTPLAGQVLQYNSVASKWENASVGVLNDGNKGDITVSGGGTTWTINTAAVTIPKISATGTPSATTFLRGDGQWAVPSGGGGSYTSSNGITLTGSNFTLGGSLNADTTITHTANSLLFSGTGSATGTIAANSLVQISNQSATNNAYGLAIKSTNSSCLYLESAAGISGSVPPTVGGQPFTFKSTNATSTGPSVFFETASRNGVYIKTGVALLLKAPSLGIENASSGAAVNAAYSLNMYTTRSTGISNIFHGRSLITWTARTTSNSDIYDFSQIEGGTEDFNDATRSGSLEFRVLASGGTSPTTRMKINPTGQIQLGAYTSLAAFPGTSVASLGVDNAGNIITITGGTGSSPLTTKGDLYTFDTANARLPVGSNGQVLVADSTTATGLKWGTAPTSGLTSVGLTMPTAFTVTNSPLTANGTIAVTVSGLSTEYIDGTGALQSFPALTGFVPYTGATQDVDLDTFKLSASSVYIEGTAGNGHLHLKHQSADATATGQSTALWADTNGDIKWKNDGNYKTTLKTSSNTADRVYTLPNETAELMPRNAAITGATKTKITYDADGLVTAGADLAASDIPTGIDATKIGVGTVTDTEFGYLDGVTSAIQTQINNKKDTITYGQVYATTVGASTTIFAAITGLTTFNATESNRHFAVPVAGIIKNFYVKMSGTQSATGTLVITIRNNATSSSVAVTVSSADGSSPTKSDNTNTLTVAAGDLLAIQLVNNATATSASVLSMAFIIERT